MTNHRLKEILAGITNVRCGVLGDFALDLYYEYTDDTGELSIETGKPVHFGRSVRGAPGGGGNVVQNLAALEPAAICVFGLVGDDLFGRELTHCFCRLGVRTDGLTVQRQAWVSHTYVKPLLGGVEQNRLDFGCYNSPEENSHRAVFAALASDIADLDLLIINQQFKTALLNADLVGQVNTLLSAHPQVLAVADCRDLIELLQGVIFKLNTDEAARILGIAEFDARSEAECRRYGRDVAAGLGGPILLTRGENGVMMIDGEQVTAIPGVFIMGDTDTVGAGDTCIAAFGLCRAAGATVAEAAELANLGAAVTVQKLNQTGTATANEISRCHAEANYIYNPDLAAGIRPARLAPDSDIELISDVGARRIRRVVIDHDGTISTLREGWAEVMFDFSMESICGDRRSAIGNDEYERIAVKVRRMIEVTTGVQTIQQMIFLAETVAAEGLVPRHRMRDAAGYKKGYLERLMVTVTDRIQMLRSGDVGVSDYTIDGAVELLQGLHDRGIELTLASGTDQEDVQREAETLGYAHLFAGGIHGSAGNEVGDAKRAVIQRLLGDPDCSGADLMVIGDGPTEIREGRRAGALCMGVASDEINRRGLNARKRMRLIRAGTDIIVPDFSQLDSILRVLGL